MKYTALITGSSRGIGRSIATRLAKEGYGIILHGSKKSPSLRSVENELKELGASVQTIFFDVSERSEVKKACKSILNRVGVVDILINNAGIFRDSSFMKMTDRDWDIVIKTNLYGPYYITSEILPGMVKKKFGRIINISSIAAKGAFGKTNYSAAKAGLIAFTKSLALEIGKYNITVNAVCPGFIESGMSSSIPGKYRKLFLPQIALGRPGRAEDVANAVNFLASPDSSYITGSVIEVNGGWM